MFKKKSNIITYFQTGKARDDVKGFNNRSSTSTTAAATPPPTQLMLSSNIVNEPSMTFKRHSSQEIMYGLNLANKNATGIKKYADDVDENCLNSESTTSTSLSTVTSKSPGDVKSPISDSLSHLTMEGVHPKWIAAAGASKAKKMEKTPQVKRQRPTMVRHKSFDSYLQKDKIHRQQNNKPIESVPFDARLQYRSFDDGRNYKTRNERRGVVISLGIDQLRSTVIKPMSMTSSWEIKSYAAFRRRPPLFPRFFSLNEGTIDES